MVVATWLLLRLLSTVTVAPGRGAELVQVGSEQARTLPLTLKPGTVRLTVSVCGLPCSWLPPASLAEMVIWPV